MPIITHVIKCKICGYPYKGSDVLELYRQALECEQQGTPEVLFEVGEKVEVADPWGGWSWRGKVLDTFVRRQWGKHLRFYELKIFAGEQSGAGTRVTHLSAKRLRKLGRDSDR